MLNYANCSVAFDRLVATRIGVLGGSVVSAIAGYLLLRASLKQAAPEIETSD